MTTALDLKPLVLEVGAAIRRPEDLVRRWLVPDGRPIEALIAVLLLNAVFGTTAYGVSMQLHRGGLAMLEGGFFTSLAAGCAWVIALPSLYIINGALGSKMTPRASILVASVTVCFGAWAMLASIPINWFFSLALPSPGVRLLVNVVIFSGVGLCMTDVFLRSLRVVDAERPTTFGFFWVCLLAIIGSELFVLFGVFNF